MHRRKKRILQEKHSALILICNRQLITAAISLFLLQNAEGDRGISQVYLETLFRRG
ncbi:MAG: DUF2811 domain-containing protein [Nostoc sp. NMS1]|uniref:DUF2811 domain-containing protein n=1 Tax=uncultured Nostoc sp. TaxID=340711 RepID=UPI0035CAB06A|nr:DUF2811 domain-containing protein [Nostoc sp. NMS1]MBN3991906.1 DUF2811 domain-containing protein [Nostoc sp. NMS2]